MECDHNIVNMVKELWPRSGVTKLLLFYQINVLLHLTLIRSLKDKQLQKRDNSLSCETHLVKNT